MTLIQTPAEAWALLKQAEREFLAHSRPLYPPDQVRREQARQVMLQAWEIYHKMMVALHGANFSRFNIDGTPHTEASRPRFTRYISPRKLRRAGQTS